MKYSFIVPYIRRCQLIRIIVPLVCVVMLPAIPALSAVTDFQSKAWDNNAIHIYRDGEPVIPSAEATLQTELHGVPYFATEENYEDLAFAFNGAGAGNPETRDKQIHQHLVAYTQPGSPEPFYHLENTTGYTVTYLITKEDLLQMGYKPRKSITVQSDVVLNGSLALARSSLEQDFSGLDASCHIVVSRVYDDEIISQSSKQYKLGEKIIFDGSIALTSTPTGKVTVTSTGNIKKQYISDFRNKLGKELKDPNEFFEIVFDDVRIPYKTKIVLDEEFKIKTEITSYLTTKGDGTGAEVFFGSDASVLESLLETIQVPDVDTIDLDNLDWAVQILIDQSETVFGDPQFSRPRDNRGLAISPDGRYLYAGYNNSLYAGGEVRCIDLTLGGTVEPFVASITGVRGKSIAVDDMGRVYLTNGTSIEVYDFSLSTHLFSVSELTKTEGVAVTREDGELVLYNSDREDGTLTKRILTEDGESIIDVMLDTDFGENGVVTLAEDLRGVEIDNQGRIWVAGFGDNMLYRVSADGIAVDFVSVNNPFDIGFDGPVVLVTRYTDLLISRFDAESLASLGPDITAPWEELALDPDGQNGAFSGIVVLPGEGFYVANEAGQTLPFEEPAGSENLVDDNDPILFAVDGNNMD